MKHVLIFTIGLIIGILMTVYFSNKVMRFWRAKAIEYSNELENVSTKVDALYAKYMTSGYWIRYYPSKFDTSRYYDIMDSMWVDLRQNIKINEK
jgi:hypothetical protein